MKFPLVTVLAGAFGVVVLLPGVVGAQMPFSSTAPPSPFNRSTGLPPTTSTARATAAQPQAAPVGGMAGNYQPGAYPPGAYPPGTTGAAGGPIDPDHRLGRGDELSYRVVEDRENTWYPLKVNDSGEVILPLGGQVKAAGKSTQQLAADIKTTLEREYYKHATVQLGLSSVAIGGSKGKIYIMGEVASKGSMDLPVDGDLTVSKAILQLGGFTMEADQKSVKIMRKGGPPKGIVVNVKAVLDGDADKDVVLQPGDTIKVAKKWINFNY